MSHKPRERMFWYRGNAMAFGGRITSPVCESLDAQGSSVLPPTGGFASATAGPFDHRGIVSIERATSTVSGRSAEHDGIATRDTLVTVAVEGLNVLDVVTADRVVARMTSKHPEGDGEPEMLPFGSYFENLRIGGHPIELTPYPDLVRNGRYRDVASTCSDRFIDAQGTPVSLEEGGELRTDEWTPGAPSPVFEDRLLLAPLFDAGSKNGYAPVGCEMRGANVIHVPGFGTIYLGEYLISRYSRRLTMLRIELGCPVEGTIVAANGGINGSDYP